MSAGLPPPDDLPKSRTGRIPQWVRDEAMGRVPDAPGFRTYTVTEAPAARRSKGRRLRGVVSLMLVLALLTGIGWVLQQTPHSGTPTASGLRPANAPPPGLEEAAAPLGTPAPHTSASRSYRFIRTTPEGSPVTWSPCRPIHYVVRPANQPKDGPRLIADAVAAVSRATGLRFVADGTTDEGPSESRAPYLPARYGDRWAPVLIVWAKPSEVPDFGVDVAGEAGPTEVTGPDGSIAYVSGTVALDPAKLLEMKAGASRALPEAVVLHELGHLVGLAHVDDSKQLMFPRASGKTVTFGAGDLAGLALLGQGPCQPSL